MDNYTEAIGLLFEVIDENKQIIASGRVSKKYLEGFRENNATLTEILARLDAQEVPLSPLVRREKEVELKTA